MNPLTSKEASKLFVDINKALVLVRVKNTEVVVCPPAIYIEKLKKSAKKLTLGVQNIYPGDMGAFTGEISVKMVANLGAKYAIVGHSERRGMGETNQIINKKIKSVLNTELTPVLCVGESERDGNHEYLNFIKMQLLESLEGVSKNSISKIVIAYEPVWAIGVDSNRPATAEEFLEISIFIKKILSDKFGAKSLEDMRIIYGGSIHPETVLPFLIEGKADGFLPGRDSINAKKFLEIIKITESVSLNTK